MVIHFLQFGVSPPILPCLHAMHPDLFAVSVLKRQKRTIETKFIDPLFFFYSQRMSDISSLDMTQEMEPYENGNTQSLGELFLQFLEYYVNFE